MRNNYDAVPHRRTDAWGDRSTPTLPEWHTSTLTASITQDTTRKRMERWRNGWMKYQWPDEWAKQLSLSEDSLFTSQTETQREDRGNQTQSCLGFVVHLFLFLWSIICSSVLKIKTWSFMFKISWWLISVSINEQMMSNFLQVLFTLCAYSINYFHVYCDTLYTANDIRVGRLHGFFDILSFCLSVLHLVSFYFFLEQILQASSICMVLM